MSDFRQIGFSDSRLLRLDAYPDRAGLPAPGFDTRGPEALVKAVAERCGGSPRGILLGSDADALVALVFRCFCAPDERVAVFEPSPASHKDAILSVGAAYVDCGRTHGWVPRLDALKMVVDDGAVGAVLGDPNDPVDGASRVVQDFGRIVDGGSAALFALIDGRNRLTSPAPAEDLGSSVIQLNRFFTGDGSPFFALCTDEERADALARIREEASGCRDADLLSVEEEKSALEGMGVRRESLESSLEQAGYMPSPSCASWAFVQQPGVDQQVLVSALKALDFATEAVRHHTWRSGVKVIPSAEDRR